MIMHQANLDYERHCRHQIKEYVKTHNKPDHKNTNAHQSLDFIYLCKMENPLGGHGLLYLQTKKVVKWHNLTKLSITPSIIKQLHTLANLDDIEKPRAKNVIFDSAWIAGVEYDDEEFDYDEYD